MCRIVGRSSRDRLPYLDRRGRRERERTDTVYGGGDRLLSNERLTLVRVGRVRVELDREGLACGALQLAGDRCVATTPR